MIKFYDKPFLQYILEMLQENNIEEVVLLLGYLPEKIVSYFGDGKKFGIKIKYSIGKIEDKTGTRLRNAFDLIDDNFLLMYCDNFIPIDIKKYIDFHNKQKTSASVLVYTNKDGFTKNNIFVDEDGFVVSYDKSRQNKDLNGVEIGFFILEKSKIKDLIPDKNFSFEKEIIPPLIKECNLSGYKTDHRYYSIGNLDRLEITKRFFKPKKVVFLDRDGVINKKAPKADYVKSWDEFDFLPGAVDAIKKLTKHNYEIYIITNQAGISRGMMKESDLMTIHKNMLEVIEKNNGKIKDIYYCPHGWDEGCECRKPKPGMFYQAAREHDLDLSKSYFIGDDERDKIAGDSAGLTTFLVNPDGNLLDVINQLPDFKNSKYISYKELFNQLYNSYINSENDRFIVTIAGCSRTGKTTLAKKLKDDLNKKGIDSDIISLDNWLVSLNDRKNADTVRERYKYSQISDTIIKLKSGKKVYPPFYNAKTRMVDKDKCSKPLLIEEKNIGIIDGIVSLDIKEVRDNSDFKIFVEIDDVTRKERLLEFYTNYKNYSKKEAFDIINPREMDEVNIIKQTKEFADFVYSFGNEDKKR